MLIFTLRATKLLWMVVVANLFVYVLVGLSLYKVKNGYEEKAEASTLNLTRTLEISCRGLLEKIDISLVAAVHEMREHNDSPENIEAYLANRIKMLPEVSAMRIADANGDTLHGIDWKRENPISINVKDRDYFKKLKTDPNAGLVISAPLVGRTTRKWSLILARRIDAPSGAFDGVAYCTLPLDYFTKVFASLELGAHGLVALRDGDLGLVARYPEHEAIERVVGSKDVSNELLRAVAADPTWGAYESVTPVDGRLRTASFRKIGPYPLYVLVAEAKDDYLGSWRNELLFGLALSLAFTLTSAVGVYLYGRSLKRQAKERERLRESEEKYSKTFWNAPLVVAVTDLETGRCLEVNNAALEAFGHGRSEILGRTLLETGVLKPEALAAVLDAVEREGRARNIEIPFLRKDGCQRTGIVSGEEISLGGRRCLISTIVDITDRKLGEEKLRRSEATARALLDFPLAASLLLDREGVILDANETFCRRFSVPYSETIGREVWGFFPAKVREFRKQMLDKALETGAPVRAEDERAGIYSDTLVTPILNDAGEVTQVTVTAYDITSRKLLELEIAKSRDEMELVVQERTRELREANLALERDIEERKKAEREKEQLEAQLRRSQILEAVGRLASGVAHDFNNLLAAIISCAWTAGRAAPGNPEVARETAHIRDLCKQGGDVSQQLTALARSSATHTTPLELVRELRHVKTLVQRTNFNHIPVTVELPGEDALYVMGDRSLLRMALLNLCINARDAMPGGGKISLSLERVGQDEKEWAVLRIRDTGLGIPPDLRQKIFEPFFTTKAQGRGVGLGLPMAYASVKAMGGELELEHSDDLGSIFTVRLPVAQSPAPETGSVVMELSHPQPVEAPGGLRILLVVDDENIGRMAQRVLCEAGHNVFRAQGGVEALDRLSWKNERADLVLLDLAVGDVHGATVYRLISKSMPRLPVVFLTPQADLAAKIDPDVIVLRQPFSAEELLDCLHQLFPN